MTTTQNMYVQQSEFFLYQLWRNITLH